MNDIFELAWADWQDMIAEYNEKIRAGQEVSDE